MRQGSQSAKLTVDRLADAAAGLGICWNQRISKDFWEQVCRYGMWLGGCGV